MLYAAIAIIVVALIFDFINGFHDAANAIATVVSTRVLSPTIAVAWAAFFNFIAFLVFPLKVASTIGKGIVVPEAITLSVVAGALVGASGAIVTPNEPDAKGQRGVVVNTASIAAFEAQIGQIAYAASKAGVAGMTVTAARDLAQYGIRVVSIAPGIVDTPMMAGMPAEIRAGLAATVPFPTAV